MNPPIQLVGEGFHVEPIVAAIQANPQLWNEHTARTRSYVHGDVSDIWIRYNAIENLENGLDSFNKEHESVWYPSADILGVKPLIFDVMRLVQATKLAGVLITKIPSGAMCHPHRDRGWHAETHEKFAVQLAGNDKQAFCFEEAKLVTRPGDLFTFDNSLTHWVTNDSDEDRMTLIICVRRT